MCLVTKPFERSQYTIGWHQQLLLLLGPGRLGQVVTLNPTIQLFCASVILWQGSGKMVHCSQGKPA